MGNAVDRRVARCFSGAIQSFDFAAMPEHRPVSKGEWRVITSPDGCVTGLAAGAIGLSGVELLTLAQRVQTRT